MAKRKESRYLPGPVGEPAQNQSHNAARGYHRRRYGNRHGSRPIGFEAEHQTTCPEALDQLLLKVDICVAQDPCIGFKLSALMNCLNTSRLGGTRVTRKADYLTIEDESTQRLERVFRRPLIR